jgi:glycosyltransferase involved in cell wall biosynthesis
VERSGKKTRKYHNSKIMKPVVSIIIPTKNSIKTIENCLLFLKNQSYEWIEIIVIDNFSTDGTFEIAQKYTSKVFQT